MFALFENLGTSELILCAVAGLLLFGRRLPEVAAQAGATLSKFRKGLDDAIHESGVEKEIRKIKDALPTDLNVRDVARAATRKVEDRMRELTAEAEKIEKEVTDSVQAPEAAKPSDTPSAPPADPGVDPAKNFGQPGSVPRE
jgi:Sec-independent protein translocase protein TatA